MSRLVRGARHLVLVGTVGLGTGAGADDRPPAPAPDPTSASEVLPDVVSEALAAMRLPAGELGFRPKGHWARYPQDPPYKLPFFDDLLANPLDTYEFTRTLGNAVEDLLTPERLRSAPAKDKPESLYSLAVTLATDRLVGGIRGFGFGLVPDAATPPTALARRLIAAGPAERGPYVERQVAELEREVEAALGPVWNLLADALDPLAATVTAVEIEAVDRRISERWRPGDVAKWLRPEFVGALPDAGLDVAVYERLVGAVDPRTQAYAGLRLLAAVQGARRRLAERRPAAGWPDIDLRRSTFFGDVVIVSRADRQPIDLGLLSASPALLVALTPVSRVSFAGSTGERRPVSIALLLDGVERIGTPTPRKEDEAGGVASGVLGTGIVYVAGAGSTLYECATHGLGCGVLGTGILVDEGGDDVYRLRNVGMGAGLFGAGLLLDAAGNDRYELLSGDGQGWGGPGGIGVLADRSGNDTYLAEPVPEKAGKERADYHSDGKIVGSNAQGAGFGRRGDLNDGRAWAGGLGVLVDVDGDDRYSAGNFSQGVGYWFGTGLLYDGGGNDTYDSVYFSHGSGAHFAIGAVVDEGGDDVHRLSDFPKVGLGPKAGAGIAFGWDVVNAFVIDRAGNDRYEADIISLGTSNIRSFSLLLDEAGDDTYVAREGALAFGAVDEQPTYVTPHRTSPFAFHLPQHALFFDLGGKDRYLRVPTAGGEPVPDATAGDDRTWSREAKTGPGAGRNVAIARDAPRGRAGFLDAWPRRVAGPAVPADAK